MPDNESQQNNDEGSGSETDSGALTVSTSDPVIESTVDHESDWKTHPDTTMSVETTQVSEPSPLYAVGVRKVVNESERSREDAKLGNEKAGSHGESRQNPRDQGGTGDDRGHVDGNGPGDQDDAKGRARSQPSMIKNLLITAAMAMICGLVGAVGYSYFFGSNHKNSSDQRQTKGQSGSQQQHASLATSRRPSHE